MSAALFDSVARIARHEAEARPVAAVGRVTETFERAGAGPDYAVSVELRDSGLVLPRVPLATGLAGFAALPAVDDLVVVVFAEGDHHAPVVVGRLYSPGVPAPDHGAGEAVLRLPPGSAAGSASLNLVIDGDGRSIDLTRGGVSVHVDGEGVQIEAGEMSVSVTTAGGGAAEVTAGGSTVALKNNGAVTISSPTTLTLEAMQIEIKASATVTVEGALVQVN